MGSTNLHQTSVLCHTLLWALGTPSMKETHPCPHAPPNLGGEGVAKPCNDHTECGAQGSKAKLRQLSRESPAQPGQTGPGRVKTERIRLRHLQAGYLSHILIMTFSFSGT